MCTRRQYAGLVLLTAPTSSAHPVKNSLWLKKASWSPVAFLVPHTIWEGQQLLGRTASQGGISFAADRQELHFFSCSGCCCLREQNKLKKNLHFPGITVSYRTDWCLSFTTEKSSRCSHWRLLQGETASARVSLHGAAGRNCRGDAAVLLGKPDRHREQDTRAQLLHAPACPPRWHVGHVGHQLPLLP